MDVKTAFLHDADYADVKTTPLKSTFSGAQFLGAEKLVKLSSKKQDVLTLFTAKLNMDLYPFAVLKSFGCGYSLTDNGFPLQQDSN
ncbi:hypothetical protein Tco_1194733 [Tanacetum coccineum]